MYFVKRYLNLNKNLVSMGMVFFFVDKEFVWILGFGEVIYLFD